MAAGVQARLFIALDVGEEDRRALGEWARAVGGDEPALRLIDPAGLHVTVAFLGHRDVGEIDGLRAQVAARAGTGTPELRTAGGLWLPPRRPRVLTIALRDSGGRLAALHDELWSDLEVLGHERERRAFRPHVTVARVRGAARPRPLPPVPQRELQADQLVLFRSWVGGGRAARYEALERAFLRGQS